MATDSSAEANGHVMSKYSHSCIFLVNRGHSFISTALPTEVNGAGNDRSRAQVCEEDNVDEENKDDKDDKDDGENDDDTFFPRGEARRGRPGNEAITSGGYENHEHIQSSIA